MRFFYYPWLFFFMLQFQVANTGIDKAGNEFEYTYIPHLDSALSYVGVREQGNNGGYWVEKFLKNVGLRRGNPWCAAFVSYQLKIGKVKYPNIRSGLARRFKTNRSVKAKNVYDGSVTIPAGYLVIWQYGYGIHGHIGIVRSNWVGPSGKTVEGNTSAGTKGSQNNGDGVYKRSRRIKPHAYFRIICFTPVEY